MNLLNIKCPKCKHKWVPRKITDIRSCPRCQHKFVLKKKYKQTK